MTIRSTNDSNQQDINISASTDADGNTIVYGYAQYDMVTNTYMP